MTKPGDVDHYTRVRCYEHVLEQYPEQTTALSLLPLAMRMAGPARSVWHAIIRKNYGCTHFIVGRDHAGPGNDSNGEPFYGPYDAQELFKRVRGRTRHHDGAVPADGLRRRPGRVRADRRDQADENVLNISGTEFRRGCRKGLEIPEWFSYPKVVEELRAPTRRGTSRASRCSSRACRVRQVDHRQRAAGQAAGEAATAM